MVPAEMAQQFREDPQKLVGTRWAFALRVNDEIYMAQLVVVVDVYEGRALLVTPHAMRFQTWRVPTSDLLAEFSAFHFYGTAEELEWTEVGENVYLENPIPSNMADVPPGIWYIWGKHDIHVQIERRSGLGMTRSNVTMAEMLEHFRPATDEERHAYHETLGGGVEEYAERRQPPPEPAPEPEPEPEPEPPVERRPAWDRIDRDED